MYYETGELQTVTNMVNGNGTATEYNKDGSIKAKYIYENVRGRQIE